MERRNFLKGMLATTSIALLAPNLAIAEEPKKIVSEFAMNTETAIKAITNGAPMTKSDLVELTVPEIAENGRVVPVKVVVNHPMEEGNYIQAIHVLTSANGNARSANVHLTPINGEAYFSTRIKLGSSQDVIAIAQTSKGEFLMSQKSVKVTIGGCG